MVYSLPTVQSSWRRDLAIDDIRPYFRLLTRLRLPASFLSFQWRLLHRLIPTGHYLFKRNIVESEQCSRCDDPSDTLNHFFFGCPRARLVWDELGLRLNRLGVSVSISISMDCALLGDLHAGIAVNTLFLWCRLYLYQAIRSEHDPSYAGFLGSARSWYNTMYAVALRAGRSSTFELQWKTVVKLLTC